VRHRRKGSFTLSPPLRAAGPPRVHRPPEETDGMADVLVIAGIAVFMAAMLGLIWGLSRI
jgi:hypothetical protein